MFALFLLDVKRKEAGNRSLVPWKPGFGEEQFLQRVAFIEKGAAFCNENITMHNCWENDIRSVQ